MPPDPLPKRPFPMATEAIRSWNEYERRYREVLAKTPDEVQALAAEIGRKVDAGEPVSVEPGGYQRITVEDAWRLLRGGRAGSVRSSMQAEIDPTKRTATVRVPVPPFGPRLPEPEIHQHGDSGPSPFFIEDVDGYDPAVRADSHIHIDETGGTWRSLAPEDDLDDLKFAWDWQAGDPDPGFGRPPDIPDSWRWTTLGLLVAALAVWRWRHGR